MHRRHILQAAGCAGFTWLAPVSRLLARQAEQRSRHEPAQSVILLWMAGGPSQLETFDPHAGRKIAGGTRAIKTAAQGIELAAGFPRLAEQMADVSLVRGMTSKEGDHERGTHLAKTGFRPDPVSKHPTLGAILCHDLPAAGAEIPRHVAILPGQWPAWGGFLGDEFNAFKLGDPAGPVPDIVTPLERRRLEQRFADLDVVERSFARRRPRAAATLHRETVAAARTMMTSDQIQAFDVSLEPAAVRARYGDTAFGRGCLAARRLIEVGVRCVEVTLDGWDSHVNNHEIHARQAAALDPAFAALLADLRERQLLERTVVICAGEFGRTPSINPFDGRDHWPQGFSLALAGGGLRGGQVVGATDPEGTTKVENPKTFADVSATVLAALGLDAAKENISPAGRPIKLSEGAAIGELVA